jgi:NTE family protein
MAMARKSDAPKLINLALQGGGAHGAFSWGVLDRLLEDPRVEIEGITGASAGAMNAVALAAGYHAGDREEARESLARFLDRRVGRGAHSPLQALADRSDAGRMGPRHIALPM